MIREYKTTVEISGPLMMVDRVSDVSYEELVEIEVPGGELRHGRVLEIDSRRALSAVNTTWSATPNPGVVASPTRTAAGP